MSKLSKLSLQSDFFILLSAEDLQSFGPDSVPKFLVVWSSFWMFLLSYLLFSLFSHFFLFAFSGSLARLGPRLCPRELNHRTSQRGFDVTSGGERSSSSSSSSSSSLLSSSSSSSSSPSKEFGLLSEKRWLKGTRTGTLRAPRKGKDP